MNPVLFEQYLTELKMKARQKVRVLREQDVVISDEAQQILASIEEVDTSFLFRRLSRQGEVTEHDWQVSP